MKETTLRGWMLLPGLALLAQSPTRDVPSRGEWDFAPQGVWEVTAAGGESVGQIGEVLVTRDGRVSVRDFAKNVSYLFDGDGRLVRSFAPVGKADGQFPFYLNRFRAGGKIVLGSPDALHFYSQDGVFERAVPNNLFLRFPLLFTSETESAGSANLAIANGTAYVVLEDTQGRQTLARYRIRLPGAAGLP